MPENISITKPTRFPPTLSSGLMQGERFRILKCRFTLLFYPSLMLDLAIIVGKYQNSLVVGKQISMISAVMAEILAISGCPHRQFGTS